MLIFALVLGFIAGTVPFVTIVLGVGATLAALKCLVQPRWVGTGRLAVPIGRPDAAIWLSVTFIPILIAIAVLQGHSPTYYIG